MAADLTTVKKRTTEILNACAGGTFSSTVLATNFDRNADAITQAITEGAMMIARRIIANPNHPHRGLYVGSAQALTHGSELPDMAGLVGLIEVQKYTGATYYSGIAREVHIIDAFRENPSSTYDAIAHDTTGSKLGGYYAIANGRIYFTGLAARCYIATVDRTTVTGLIPDEYEGVWVALSVGLTVKEGDNLMPVAQHYFNSGMAELEHIERATNVNPITTIQSSEVPVR
jgi:hypothetical protein